MNILMLSSTFPYPPSRGGTEIRTFNLLKYLGQRHAVTLVTQRHADVTEAEVVALRAEVADLQIFDLPAPAVASSRAQRLLGQGQRFAQSLLTQTPPNVLHRYSPAMQNWIDQAVQSGRYGAVTCEHSVNEIYIRPSFRQQLKTLVDVHSSVYAWTRNHLEMGASQQAWRDRLYLPLLKRYEQRYCSKFSQVVVTTEEDRQEILRLSPQSQVSVIPNGVDLELFPCRTYDPSSYDLVFVGAMDASHNIDAARFFALEVMPQLRQRYPSATFRIVGARPVAAVQQLADCPGVVVTGQVPSMVDELHKATVCVVPLRTGFGIKNKTLEAMAAGVPVVGSDRGLEGLTVDGTPPLRALRANQVEEYLQAISTLFEDAALRTHLSQMSRIFVEQTYTWEQAGAAYEQVLSE
jgi:polysaccharide biosynthesis protein PslH